MKIESRKILTLDDNNDYVVVGVVEYNNSDYIYIVDINNHTNMKFAEVDKDGSLLILNSSEKKLINKLIPLFYNSCKDIKYFN